MLAAKARRYAAMSTAGAGGAVGDADQFLVDFEQKRYDDDGSEREVDALAAAASSDTPCPLRSELELHAASQSTQAAVARRQRDAALQVRLGRRIVIYITDTCFFTGAPCQTCSVQRAQFVTVILLRHNEHRYCCLRGGHNHSASMLKHLESASAVLFI